MNAPEIPLTQSTPEQRFRALAQPQFEDLAHLPGLPERRKTLLNTVRFMRDPLGHTRQYHADYGPVYRSPTFTGWGVTLIGPDANELLLVNQDNLFSSEQGWHTVLELLFPRGLMLMDNPEHRHHRRTLSVAFKTGPMRFYFDGLQRGCRDGLRHWTPSLRFYPAIKALTLDLAAGAFLGLPWGPDAKRINKAFVDMVQASIAPIRKPIPGTQMWRGVRGRRFMSEFFTREIPKRRGGNGEDFFSQFCNVRHDDGSLLSDQEVIDHMNFLMMAAHDTITSSLTSAVYFLAREPQWQEWVREEISALPTLSYDNMEQLERCDMVLKESMRLNPPVPAIPRRSLREFEFEGHRVPAGTVVSISTMLTHRLPELWHDPERFDPQRFSSENSAGRHRYAWVPFGGGAHMCLGLHFAYMQARVFLYEFLSQYRVSLKPGSKTDWAMFPIVRPRDGLPITLERINRSGAA